MRLKERSAGMGRGTSTGGRREDARNYTCERVKVDGAKDESKMVRTK